MPPENDSQRAAQTAAQRAADALAGAKADARARGEPGPAAVPAARAGATPQPPPATAQGQPGVRTRRDDPQPLRTALDGLLSDQGWRTAAAIGSVTARWQQIVGPELAAHTRPGPFTDGELVVTADSTAWATQLRLLAPALVRRLGEELGDGRVTRVKVRGPAPPASGGRWRVRGGRGPRDDYG